MSHVEGLGALDYVLSLQGRSDGRDFSDLSVPHKGCPTRDESRREIGISRLWVSSPPGMSDERDFGDLCTPLKGCPTRDESRRKTIASNQRVFIQTRDILTISGEYSRPHKGV